MLPAWAAISRNETTVYLSAVPRRVIPKAMAQYGTWAAGQSVTPPAGRRREYTTAAG